MHIERRRICKVHRGVYINEIKQNVHTGKSETEINNYRR